MRKLNLDASYKLVETDVRNGEQTIVKTFLGYAEAKSHLKQFENFLIDEKKHLAQQITIRYKELGCKISEVEKIVNNDLRLPLMFNRNTAMLDGFYKYEIKKEN